MRLFAVTTNATSVENGSEISAHLCAGCRALAPKDSLLFEKLFLRFASKKEFLLHYGEEDESIAIHRWCREVGLDPAEAERLLSDNSGVFGLSLERGSQSKPRSRQAPYGYSSNGSFLSPLPEEADVVREIFRLYAEGVPLERIARSLNSKEIPTRRGGRWQKSTVSYILRNPLYAGYKRRNGRMRPSSHPPIVDPQTFELVQESLRRRRTSRTATKTTVRGS